MPPARQLSVFLSCTCYDLGDLRAELAAFLRGQDFDVRVSEDVSSSFRVDPTDNSIEICLANVRESDVVVCVIDRRYGGIINAGDYKGMSATEAEVRFARSLSPPKPVLFFVRDAAMLGYETLRQDRTATTKHVERLALLRKAPCPITNERPLKFAGQPR